MIETIIVEASLDKQTKLGVEYTMLPSKIFGGKGTSGSGNVGFGLNTTPAGEGVNYTISSGQYKSFINAIQTDTKFKVLDTPRIFTSNNVKAEINVSQKIPYITTQTTNSLGNVVSNYTFQDVGVVLTVTPRITSNGNVTMDVVQSADDLKGFTDFNAPIINHRQASTTVSVADGATIVLGGIIRHTLTQTDKKVPFFGDLPLIGNFFKASDKTLGQTELMVFLTPHVIHSAAEAERIRKEQAEQLSKQSQGDVKNIIKGGG
jgi:general secretion pathway protein D